MIKNKSPSIAELINILYSVIEENRKGGKTQSVL